MIDLSALSPGMQVKIVDAFPRPSATDGEGIMDRFLGQIVTVERVNDDSIFIKEDLGTRRTHPHWLWYTDMIECIVDDARESKPAFSTASEAEVLSFLLGGEQYH